MKAILHGVPHGRMLVLDLYVERRRDDVRPERGVTAARCDRDRSTM
jgi:hypothetical protein